MILPSIQKCADILEYDARTLRDVSRFLEPGDKATIFTIMNHMKDIAERLQLWKCRCGDGVGGPIVPKN